MTKHTDTSRSGELVETLLCVDRGGVLHSRRPKQTHPVCAKAAARIAALEAENERLRVQLAQTIMQQDEEWQNKKAENERLNSLINDTANHWLRLQCDHPVGWVGAIDTAMEAACDEIRRLSAALGEKQ